MSSNFPSFTNRSAEPEQADAARQVGLRYVSDDMPGLHRISAKTGFRYLSPDGSLLRDKKTLERVQRLAIPPAWRDVWICPDANGHLQATGRDARQRKQYRYHPDWRRVRDETKYERVISFGEALPVIRKRIAEDITGTGFTRDKVLATVIHLLQTTMMRVGNAEYARTNKSYGLTTLCNRHVQVEGNRLRFSFRGKSGVRHSIMLDDRRLTRLVKQMRDLPGQALFQYLGDDGELHAVSSSDVNDYLRAITCKDYTAKDFRTWSGTMLAARALKEYEGFTSEAEARRNIKAALEQVAEKLGNTLAICRKCYVHPAIIDAYLDRSIPSVAPPRQTENSGHELSPEERSLISLLQQRTGESIAKNKDEALSAGSRGSKPTAKGNTRRR
jgi:DNA topoisomerase-1